MKLDNLGGLENICFDKDGLAEFGRGEPDPQKILEALERLERQKQFTEQCLQRALTVRTPKLP